MMKKTIKFILFTLILGLYLNAQEKLVKRNELNISVVQIIDGNFRMGYEYSLTPKTGLNIFGSFMMYADDVYEAIGGSAEFQYRFYSRPEKTDWVRLYLAPYSLYKYIDEHDRQINVVSYKSKIYRNNYYNIFGLGVMTGLKVTVMDNFIFDFSIGGGMRYAENPESSTMLHSDNGIFSIDYTGVVPRANLSIGVMF